MEEKGVSSIVVIAIVIVIAAAAAIGGYYLGTRGGGGGEGWYGTPQSVLLSVSASASGNNVVLTISNEGGDNLVMNDISVKAIKGTGPTENAASINIGTGTFRVGNSLKFLCLCLLIPSK